MSYKDFYQRAKSDIKKRASKKAKDYITTNIHDIPKIKKIAQLNNNDYEGLIGQVNLNDYEGVDASSFNVLPETEPSVDNEIGLLDNVLHKFATYNTIFTLSGVSEDEMKTHAYLTNPVHDIIARSGGIGDPKVSSGKYKEQQDELAAEIRENRFRGGGVDKTYNKKYDPKESAFILGRGLDLFIENFNMLSTVGPNTERGLANISKMNFEVVEPFGTSLIEKIKAATFINGYRDFMDAPLLLTIEFKGTDENGKPITTDDKNYVRKIPILIVRVEFDLDQSGTKYQVIAVPHGDLAHDDRFKFPRTQLTTSVNSVGEWIKEVTKQLNDDQDKEIKEGLRQYKDTYEFYVSSEVAERAKYAKTLQTTIAESNASFLEKFYNNYIAGERTKIDFTPEIKLAEAQVDGQTSLVKYFEDAIRTGEGYSAIADRFWQYWHMQMTQSVGGSPTQTSSTTNKTGSDDYDGLMQFYNSDAFRAQAKNNQWIPWFEIKVDVKTPKPNLIDRIRKVSPKIIIFKAIPKKLHCLKFFPPGVSLGFMDWSKWVRKQYNYIYTGDNTDVQNLRINYKTAYYLRNVRPFTDEHKAKGKYENFQENLIQVFGNNDSDIRIEPSIQKGKNTMASGSNKSQQFYDYITNPQVDMMKIELEILGDPAFICQDQYIGIHEDRGKKADGIGPGVISKKFGSFNSENFQPLIQVNFVRPPDDIDDEIGAYVRHAAAGTEAENTFSGIYQVVKVDSKFNQGQFLQTLHCVRLNQQQQGDAGAVVEQAIYKNYKNEKVEATTVMAGSKNADKLARMNDVTSDVDMKEAWGKLKGKAVETAKKVIHAKPGKNATSEKGGTLASENWNKGYNKDDMPGV